MPQLSKKKVVPKRKNFDFKLPLLTKENIEEALKTREDKSYSNPQKTKEDAASTNSKNSKSSKKSIRSVSISLSCEEKAPVILNHPAIKNAFLQFRSSQSLSQTLTQTSNITDESLLDQSKNLDLSFDKYLDEIFTESQKQDSLQLSQTVLKRDKTEIIEFPKETQCEDQQLSPVIHGSGKQNTPKNKNSKQKGRNEFNKENINNIKEEKCKRERPVKKNKENITKDRNKEDRKTKKHVFQEKQLEGNDMSDKEKPKRKKRQLIEQPVASTSLDLSIKNQKTKRTAKLQASNFHKKNYKPKTQLEKQLDQAYNDSLTVYERMILCHESRNVGLYALCDLCDKARYLPNVKDPLGTIDVQASFAARSALSFYQEYQPEKGSKKQTTSHIFLSCLKNLPENWYCYMNPDSKHNKCSDPEEVSKDPDFLIENLYNSGSIVWAKMKGFPWWPAMVEDDPDTEEYFWLEEGSVKPSWYHVTFFDSMEVTRAWMLPEDLKPFKLNTRMPITEKIIKETQIRLDEASKQALDACSLPLLDRLKKYSFIYRYKRTKQLMNVPKSVDKNIKHAQLKKPTDTKGEKEKKVVKGKKEMTIVKKEKNLKKYEENMKEHDKIANKETKPIKSNEERNKEINKETEKELFGKRIIEEVEEEDKEWYKKKKYKKIIKLISSEDFDSEQVDAVIGSMSNIDQPEDLSIKYGDLFDSTNKSFDTY